MRAVALGGLLALGLWACAVDDYVASQPPFACEVDGQCVAGFTCQAGECRRGAPECVEDLDCPAGRVCEASACVEPAAGRCRDAAQCAADQACMDGRCAAQPAPGDERCNGQDDDGDGQVDEGAVAEGLACAPVGVGACARAGEPACVDGQVRCPEVEAGEAEDEACNGVDDDCDGDVDEELDCEGCEPSPERCNGVDDDCDGEADEGLDLGGECLSAGEGECQQLGQWVCGDDGDVACSAAPTQPEDERCNGLDDDCDGAVDEGACGPGRCERDDDCPGPQVCIEGACGGLCEAETPAQPAGCCEQAGDACLEARTYCPGLPELDPCPRRRKTVFSAGACVAAVVCTAEAEIGFSEAWCDDLGGDRCEAGGCVADPRCRPAACAGQPEGARCAGGQARCVEGVCWGFANPSPEANARGPSFRVPIVDAEAGNRVGWSGTQEHDQYSDLMWSLGPDQERPARADDWASAHAACQAFRGLGASDWRLPTVHEAVTLMGSGSWAGEPPLITRTHLDGEAVVVNPWPADGDPIVDTLPYDAPVTYRCVRYFQGRPDLPADRFPDAGGDGWVGLAWAPQPQVHPTAAAALRACANHPDGLRLARVEEVIARLDARPGARGELRDVVDPNESEAWWFAIAEGDEQRYVRVQLSTLTIEDDAQPRGARALCVRPLSQQICAADADCAAPQVCHGDGRCHRGEQCLADADCQAGQLCIEGLCGRAP